MLRKILLFIRKYYLQIDDRPPLERAIEKGLRIGKNCSVMGECILDPGHCWLIDIGNNVTLAPRVHILAHDASTKRILGFTRIQRTIIGNNVFIGAGSIILPGVTIGDYCIIGAGSVVSKSIPERSIAVGNPAVVIGTFDNFIQRKKDEFENSPHFDKSYKVDLITPEKKEEMIRLLSSGKTGYIY